MLYPQIIYHTTYNDPLSAMAERLLQEGGLRQLEREEERKGGGDRQLGKAREMAKKQIRRSN